MSVLAPPEPDHYAPARHVPFTPSALAEARKAAESRLGRKLTRGERAINIVRADRELTRGKEMLAAAIETEKRRVVRTMVERGRRARMRVTPEMTAVLSWLFERGREHALSESAKLGVPLTRTYAEPSRLQLFNDRIAVQLGPVQSRVERDVAHADFELGDSDVARALERQIPGALNAAGQLVSSGFSDGLEDVFAAHASLYSGWEYSAVMDGATCDPCAEHDGETYETIEEMYAVLPNFGPNPECLGEGRCRCRGVPAGPADETPDAANVLDVPPPTLSPEQEQSLQLVGQVARLVVSQQRAGSGLEIFGPEDMLLREGKVFSEEIPPDRDLGHGTPQECYSNAFNIALENEDLTYVEGKVVLSDVPFPVEHAWTVDRLGRVYDTTLATNDRRGAAYVGVPLQRDWVVKQAVERETYGPFLDHKFPYDKPLADDVVSREIPGVPFGDVEGKPKGLAEIVVQNHQVEIYAAEDKGVIRISSIKTPEELRGKGLASKALDDILAYADATGQRVALTPEPIVRGKGGLSKKKLEDWYKRRGFVKNTDPAISESRVREPVEAAKPISTEAAAFERSDEVMKAIGAHDLEGGQTFRPDLYEKHPRSGFMVRNDKPKPTLVNEPGKPPRIQDTVPHRVGGNEVPVPGTLRPPRYLFRAVSEEDYQAALERGYLKSDGRMNLGADEGTVASLTDPGFYLPGKLASDAPGRYLGRVLRIEYRDSDGWLLDRDGYVKTPDQIPMTRVDLAPQFETTKGADGYSFASRPTGVDLPPREIPGARPVGAAPLDLKKLEKENGLADWPPRRHPEVDELLGGRWRDSQEKYSKRVKGRRVYDAERIKIQDAILDKAFEGKTPLDRIAESERVGLFEKGLITRYERDTGLAEGTRLKALVTAGGPSAGKSTAVKLAGYAEDAHTVVIEADAFEKALPEYKKMLEVAGARKYTGYALHNEAADLSRRALDRATRGGYNIVIDTHGNSGVGRFNRALEKLVRDGYDTDVVMVDIPTEMAQENVALRAAKDGRYIDQRRVGFVYDRTRINHDEWRTNPAIAWKLYDNSGAVGQIIRGEKPSIAPKLVAEKTRAIPPSARTAEQQAAFERADAEWVKAMQAMDATDAAPGSVEYDNLGLAYEAAEARRTAALDAIEPLEESHAAFAKDKQIIVRDPRAYDRIRSGRKPGPESVYRIEQKKPALTVEETGPTGPGSALVKEVEQAGLLGRVDPEGIWQDLANHLETGGLDPAYKPSRFFVARDPEGRLVGAVEVAEPKVPTKLRAEVDLAQRRVDAAQEKYAKLFAALGKTPSVDRSGLYKKMDKLDEARKPLTKKLAAAQKKVEEVESELTVARIASNVSGGGTTLMREAARIASERGKGIILTANKESRGFYARLGMPFDVGKVQYVYRFRFSPEAVRKWVAAPVSPVSPLRVGASLDAEAARNLAEHVIFDDMPEASGYVVKTIRDAFERDPSDAWANIDQDISVGAKIQVMRKLAARLADDPAFAKLHDWEGADWLQNYRAMDEEGGRTMDETITDGLVHQWAQTAADNDAWSLAIQTAIKDEFGLQQESLDVAFAGKRPQFSYESVVEPSTARQSAEITEAVGDSLRAFVRAQYEETQDWLALRGIDKVQVYRGMGHEIGREGEPFTAERRNVVLQPGSSFSISARTADAFKPSGGVLLLSDIPAERILSIPRTGFGSFSEAEVVALGPPEGVTDQMWVRYGSLTGSQGLSALDAAGTIENALWDEVEAAIRQEEAMAGTLPAAQAALKIARQEFAMAEDRLAATVESGSKMDYAIAEDKHRAAFETLKDAEARVRASTPGGIQDAREEVARLRTVRDQIIGEHDRSLGVTESGVQKLNAANRALDQAEARLRELESIGSKLDLNELTPLSPLAKREAAYEKALKAATQAEADYGAMPEGAYNALLYAKSALVEQLDADIVEAKGELSKTRQEYQQTIDSLAAKGAMPTDTEIANSKIGFALRAAEDRLNYLEGRKVNIAAQMAVADSSPLQKAEIAFLQSGSEIAKAKYRDELERAIDEERVKVEAAKAKTPIDPSYDVSSQTLAKLLKRRQELDATP